MGINTLGLLLGCLFIAIIGYFWWYLTHNMKTMCKKQRYDFYLAGGMRGFKDFNHPLFNRVAAILREQGFTVWNPAEHNNSGEVTFAECMTIDLDAVVNQCDGIALLPGWENSLGANVEAFVAFSCGKTLLQITMGETTAQKRNNLPIRIGWNVIDLSDYRLPYRDGETKAFNPHKVDLDKFE